MNSLHEELIFKLCRMFNNDEIQFILDQVDDVLTEYNITKKETLPVVDDNERLGLRYLKSKQLEGVSDGTISTYACYMRRFIKSVNKSVLLLTTSDIRNYLLMVKETTHISDRSLEECRIVLNGFYKWLIDEDYIYKNPVSGVKKIKYEVIEKEPYSPEDMEKLRFVCRNDYRLTAIIEFLYSTGCRVSEMVNIKKSDIDFIRGEVCVKGKGKKYRTLYISVNALNALERYIKNRKNDTDYIISHNKKMGNIPISTDQIRSILRKAGIKANISRRIRPHEIRHTTATDALDKGMSIESVQCILGHDSINTTLLYAKVNQNRVRSEHKKCFS